jgi:hypothetical protein
MSKILKIISNCKKISLLTYSLLILPIAANAQEIPTRELQIKGWVANIEGRQLIVPDLAALPSALSSYRKGFESEIRQLPQFQTQLQKIPFAQLNSNLAVSVKTSFLAIADNYWSKAEYADTSLPASQYVSGTVTCTGKNVPVAPTATLAVSYLELTDRAGKNGYYYGKRWISGDQQVEGGCGILKAINGGKEPAGRLVWGTDTFKIVLSSVDESKQRAEFQAYMRICATLPLGAKTCTPYFIPLPWFPVQGNNWVVIGSAIS